MLGWVTAVALFTSAASVPPLQATALSAAKKKKKPAKKKEKDKDASALSKALEGQKDMVESCLIVTAPVGPWKRVVRAIVEVDSSGATTGVDVSVTPTSDKVQECVEKILKMAPFPKGGGTAAREWTFSGE